MTLLFSAGALLIAFGLLATAAVPNTLGAPPSATPTPQAGTALSLRITDNTRLSTALGQATSEMLDAVHVLTTGGHSRSYSLVLTVAHPDSAQLLLVETNPILEWSAPQQLPGGPDNLPPLPLWNWTVTTGGVNDTSNWTVTRYTADLVRTIAWENQTYVVRGTSDPTVPLSVPVQPPAGDSAPQVGLLLQNPSMPNTHVPTKSPSYRGLIDNLRPKVIRLSLSSLRTYAYWDNVTQSPVFNFTEFDTTLNFTTSIGADVLLSVPVGTWGDGNDMPYGMPVNHGLPITFLGITGYFPTAAAFQRFVDVLAAHVRNANETIRFWSIGNEQPLPNDSIAARYIAMFNIAQAAVHGLLPQALVGSDVLTNRTYFSSFAHQLRNVGFLSYHFYPAIGYCVQNGSYCPPAGGRNDTTDPKLFRPVAELSADPRFFAPHLAQEMWYNITQRWIPVLDTESNLNAVGGGGTAWVGTDPRDQTLFGAAWLVATLVDSSSENVSTLTYLTATDPAKAPVPTLTAPYGGWGFGLARPISRTTYLQYAPYWALEIWANNVPAGSVAAVVPTPDPTLLRAFEDRNSTGLSVVLVNLAAVPVHVPITLTAGGYQAQSVTVLDSKSYVERFNVTTQREHLLHSGLTQAQPLSPTVTVTIHGYGVAAVHFAKAPSKGPRDHPRQSGTFPTGPGNHARIWGENGGLWVRGPGSVLQPAAPLLAVRRSGGA